MRALSERERCAVKLDEEQAERGALVLAPRTVLAYRQSLVCVLQSSLLTLLTVRALFASFEETLRLPPSSSALAPLRSGSMALGRLPDACRA